MKKTYLLLLLLCMSASLYADDIKGTSYIGIRLGIGHSDLGEIEEQFIDYVINVEENGFYTEAFFTWHFLNELALDVSLASLSRGEFRWDVPGGRLFGNLNIYPVAVGLKIKPLMSQLSETYQPYVAGGGALVIGRAVVEGGTVIDPYAYYDRDAESETTFGWWLSGGFDSFISTTICLSANFRYNDMSFSDPIGGYSDHSGYQISFGIAYIFRKIKQ